MDDRYDPGATEEDFFNTSTSQKTSGNIDQQYKSRESSDHRYRKHRDSVDEERGYYRNYFDRRNLEYRKRDRDERDSRDRYGDERVDYRNRDGDSKDSKDRYGEERVNYQNRSRDARGSRERYGENRANWNEDHRDGNGNRDRGRYVDRDSVYIGKDRNVYRNDNGHRGGRRREDFRSYPDSRLRLRFSKSEAEIGRMVWARSPSPPRISSGKYKKEKKEDTKDRKKKKKKEKEKKKKEKERKRKKSKKIEKQKAKDLEKKNESDIDNATESDDDDDEEEEEFGPVMSENNHDSPTAVSTTKLNYGEALLPGEGKALAQYAANKMRIPRRGEIAHTAEEIDEFHRLGYVMSTDKHKTMAAVRQRKENQIRTALEEQELAIEQAEQLKREEEERVAQLRQKFAQKLAQNKNKN